MKWTSLYRSKLRRINARPATAGLKIKVLKIDNEINNKYTLLLEKYGTQQATMPDCVIAATAWAKNLPLLTRNKRHFQHIKEIRLVPPYEYKEQ